MSAGIGCMKSEFTDTQYGCSLLVQKLTESKIFNGIFHLICHGVGEQ